MYSTCVSECFVPLMKVTPETIGHDPCSRTISSAPSPFRTVATVACGKRPSSAFAAGRSPAAFVATIARSNGSRASGSLAAVTRACRSLLPLTRRPSRFSASACSRRRVSTETSHTWARCPAKRLPITPAPTMQTRSITPGLVSRALTCQSTRRLRRRAPLAVDEAAELRIGHETALPRPQLLDGVEELRIPLLGKVEPEIAELDADRVEPALLAEDDA